MEKMETSLCSMPLHDVNGTQRGSSYRDSIMLTKLNKCAAGRVETDQKMKEWQRQSRFKVCLKSFQAIDNVRAHIRPEEDGFSDVPNDAENKLKLFMAHTVRCRTKNEEIDGIYKVMLREPAETFAVLTMV